MSNYHMNESKALEWLTKLKRGDKVLLVSINECFVRQVVRVTPTGCHVVHTFNINTAFYPDGRAVSKNYKTYHLEEWTPEREQELIDLRERQSKLNKAQYILRELYDHRNRGWLTDEVAKCINEVVTMHLPADVLKGTQWEEFKNEAETGNTEADTEKQGT